MEELAEELGNCVYKYLVEDDRFNHFDFVYHKNAGQLLYKHVAEFMRGYAPKLIDN